MKRWNVVNRLIVMGCALVLAGCAASQAKVTMLQAPEVAEAAAFKSMSVARFSGQYGDSLSTAIESAMMNARVQDKPVYRSVSRAPEGRSLGGSHQALASTARSQGADAILVGEVTGDGGRGAG